MWDKGIVILEDALKVHSILFSPGPGGVLDHCSTGHMDLSSLPGHDRCEDPVSFILQQIRTWACLWRSFVWGIYSISLKQVVLTSCLR